MEKLISTLILAQTPPPLRLTSTVSPLLAPNPLVGPRSLNSKAKAFPGPEATFRQGAFKGRANCYPPWVPTPYTQTKDSVCTTPATPYRLQAQGRRGEAQSGRPSLYTVHLSTCLKGPSLT